MGVIERCVENIYSVYPLQRDTLLSRNELKDIDINLHAFFVNIFGLLDNMAWVVVYEKGLQSTIPRMKVGLFKNEIKAYLSEDFRTYLYSERMQRWHDEYLKEYRDTLSHRIPLYVPPKRLTNEQIGEENELSIKINQAIKEGKYLELEMLGNEAEAIGEPAPFFVHSLEEAENKVVMLHAQVITDFKTVEEIINKFCEMF